MSKNKKTKKEQNNVSVDKEIPHSEPDKLEQIVSSLDNRDAALQYQIKLVEGSSGEVISNINGTITLSMLLSNILLPGAVGTYSKTLDSMITAPAKADFRHYVDTRLKALEEEARLLEEESQLEEQSNEEGLEVVLEEDSYAELGLEEEETDDSEEE